MKNWDTLQPDTVKILNTHYNEGRDGKEIKKIVVHHNGANLSIQRIWEVWQTRKASAHYQVTSDGTIGQLVWDRNTAWHSGNRATNQESIGVEHANSGNATSPLTRATLENGAHLVAALCRHYKLGRPQWKVNVFPHSSFTSTDCPGTIASSQRDEYMARAQHWYDTMTGATPKPKPAPTTRVTKAPPYPLPRGYYYGPPSGPIQSVSGRTRNSAVPRDVVQRNGQWYSKGLETAQARLKARGWAISTDGRYGPETETIVRKFQTNKRLKVDGLIGPKTWTALWLEPVV